MCQIIWFVCGVVYTTVHKCWSIAGTLSCVLLQEYYPTRVRELIISIMYIHDIVLIKHDIVLAARERAAVVSEE